MKIKTMGMLILMNALLLAAVWLVGGSSPQATAQISLNSSASGGPYVMVSGASTGDSGVNVVYIVDMRSSRMAAVIYNGSSNTFTPLSVRDLAKDMEKTPAASR